MKYKIKVGNKYLIGEGASVTLKFCDNIEDADAKDAVTACDYVRGIMERQNCGFYPGEIKLIDADAEETVVHCNNEENARIIATLLDMDADGHYLTYSSIFGEEEEPAPPKEG